MVSREFAAPFTSIGENVRLHRHFLIHLCLAACLQLFHRGFVHRLACWSLGIGTKEVHEPVKHVAFLLESRAVNAGGVTVRGSSLAMELGKHLENLLVDARLFLHLLDHLAPIRLHELFWLHVKEEEGVLFMSFARQL